MVAILGAAYLHICERCSGHGSIKCPDGFETPSFISKVAAYEAAAELLERGKIDTHEHEFLTYQIARCPLPAEEPAELAKYQEEVFRYHGDFPDLSEHSKKSLH